MTTKKAQENMKHAAPKKRSQLGMVWHQLLKNKLAVCGLIIFVAIILASLFVSVFVDYDKIILHDLMNKNQTPSLQHWFGTDSYGRDLLLRILYGARISLFIGVTSVLGGMLLGGAVGAISGFYGGKIDIVVMRFMDILMAIPSTLFCHLRGFCTWPGCDEPDAGYHGVADTAVRHDRPFLCVDNKKQ